MKTSGGGFALGVPESMRVGTVDPDGWSKWRAIDSPLNPNQLSAFKNKAPSLFLTYLSHKCLMMSDLLVSLPQTPSDEPLKEFLEFVGTYERDQFFKDNSLFPFGFDSNDSGFLCFDYSKEGENYPIVLVDFSRQILSERWKGFSELLDDIEKDLMSYEE